MTKSISELGEQIRSTHAKYMRMVEEDLHYGDIVWEDQHQLHEEFKRLHTIIEDKLGQKDGRKFIGDQISHTLDCMKDNHSGKFYGLKTRWRYCAKQERFVL